MTIFLKEVRPSKLNLAKYIPFAKSSVLTVTLFSVTLLLLYTQFPTISYMLMDTLLKEDPSVARSIVIALFAGFG